MIHHRPIADEAEFTRLLDFLKSIYSSCPTPLYLTFGDLDYQRAINDDPEHWRTIELWLADENIVGFAWLHKDYADHQVAPTHGEIESDIINWLMKERPAGLELYANVHDTNRQHYLGAAGFESSDDYMNAWRRDLGDVPKPVLPDGFTFSSMAEYTDYDDRAEAHRDAFDSARMTPERYSRVRQAQSYRPDFDFVILAPDGRAASYCTVWFDDSNHLIYFEPVGCRHEFQRQGLTRQLMYHAMRYGKECGATQSLVLSHDITQAPASNGLYPGVGHTFWDAIKLWKRPEG